MTLWSDKTAAKIKENGLENSGMKFLLKMFQFFIYLKINLRMHEKVIYVLHLFEK